jgi:hypothetical protein
MRGQEEAVACDSCGESPVVVRCGSKSYCQRCGEWMASSRVERGWAALEALDYGVGAMLRAHFTTDEIERAVSFRIHSSGGTLADIPLTKWLTVDPPSLSAALGGKQTAPVPPDFELLGAVHVNGAVRST